ncbi:dual specificity protein phosphatase 26-like [Triplophysa dalaica]|uniref:dual specificity protein phosphatase 26-like n=1 Tax=Triplophysa dalaica TaxID=1582913 RepID=UPI0024DFA031|nr:dual specificity protein phosphatase 26-like [Triplophysa dalaica]
MAVNYGELKACRFTHVLNCVDKLDSSKNYRIRGIRYLGINTLDLETFNISVLFKPAAEFIHTALMEEGKILVHCWAGVSRSATIVSSYLMLKQNMTLKEAINTVKEKRGILPNRGFLRQLLDLQTQLYGS